MLESNVFRSGMFINQMFVAGTIISFLVLNYNKIMMLLDGVLMSRIILY